MAPAMRTCATTEARPENLSENSPARRTCCEPASTWSWSSRTAICSSRSTSTRACNAIADDGKGLSVAAVSYYVVRLFGYLVKGAHDEGVPVDISLATALFVPVAVAAIWWLVRRIRRRHIAGDK